MMITLNDVKDLRICSYWYPRVEEFIGDGEISGIIKRMQNAGVAHMDIIYVGNQLLGHNDIVQLACDCVGRNLTDPVLLQILASVRDYKNLSRPELEYVQTRARFYASCTRSGRAFAVEHAASAATCGRINAAHSAARAATYAFTSDPNNSVAECKWQLEKLIEYWRKKCIKR